MFKNTRLSAVLAAVLFSVTAASVLMSAPAFADAPKAADAAAAPAASAPAADAAAAPAASAPAADAAAAPAPAAAPAGAKEEVENPFGFSAVWAVVSVPRPPLTTLSRCSMGSWKTITPNLLDKIKFFNKW